MSLSGEVLQAVTDAFEDAGDLVGNFTISSADGTFDPDTNTYTESSTDQVAKGLYDKFNDEEIDHTTVKIGDHIIWLKAELGLTLEIRDTISDGVTSYDIIGIQEIKTYTTVFLYKLHVRT